jgi:hypothetical protein
MGESEGESEGLGGLGVCLGLLGAWCLVLGGDLGVSQDNEEDCVQLSWDLTAAMNLKGRLVIMSMTGDDWIRKALMRAISIAYA